ASAATAAAPWYAVAATRQVAMDTLASAPAASSLISVSLRLRDAEALVDPTEDLRPTFHPDGFTTVVGATSPVRLAASGTATAGGDEPGDEDAESGTAGALPGYREHVCAHLVVQGACPAAAGEALTPAGRAEAEGIAIGEPIRIARSEQELAGARLTCTFQVTDAP